MADEHLIVEWNRELRKAIETESAERHRAQERHQGWLQDASGELKKIDERIKPLEAQAIVTQEMISDWKEAKAKLVKLATTIIFLALLATAGLNGPAILRLLGATAAPAAPTKTTPTPTP